MIDLFYRSFEERFYAPRSVILNLRKQYLDFCKPLAKIYHGAPCFDVGCGRGEWLELMLELGFSAKGVDLDDGMLQACEDLGLPATQGDAIEHLKTLPDDSQAIVTAFHVVEHITFEQLTCLISNALRVLVPGGLLIMETPNPENIIVATRNFYLDPTHQRPIPPLLLEFLPEYYGFSRTKTIRLQQNPNLESKATLTLNDVLGGASPDYAVIGQKSAETRILELFDNTFSIERGLTTHSLANRYDEDREKSVEEAKTISQQAVSSADNALTVAQQAVADARQTRTLVVEMEATLRQYQQLATTTEQHINALLASTSWQVTAPLRWMSTASKRLLSALWRVVRFGVRTLLLPAMRFVLARPTLRTVVSRSLERFPEVAHRLHLLAINRGLISAPVAPKPKQSAPAAASERQYPLTPHAKHIYDELTKAIVYKQRTKNQ